MANDAGLVETDINFATGGDVGGFAALVDYGQPKPIPEPGTLALFGLGLAGLGLAR